MCESQLLLPSTQPLPQVERVEVVEHRDVHEKYRLQNKNPDDPLGKH